MRLGSVTGAAVAWLAAMAVTVGAAGLARRGDRVADSVSRNRYADSGLRSTERATQANPDLPDGEGLKILQASCTGCHELTEVTKFKGFYTREDWRDVIK